MGGAGVDGRGPVVVAAFVEWAVVVCPVPVVTVWPGANVVVAGFWGVPPVVIGLVKGAAFVDVAGVVLLDAEDVVAALLAVVPDVWDFVVVEVDLEGVLACFVVVADGCFVVVVVGVDFAVGWLPEDVAWAIVDVDFAVVIWAVVVDEWFAELVGAVEVECFAGVIGGFVVVVVVVVVIVDGVEADGALAVVVLEAGGTGGGTVAPAATGLTVLHNWLSKLGFFGLAPSTLSTLRSELFARAFVTDSWEVPALLV
jgi:hypothetical protein